MFPDEKLFWERCGELLIESEKFSEAVEIYIYLFKSDPFSSLYLEKYNGKDAVAVEVISKSCMYFKMAQMNARGSVSEETASLINVENKIFIENIARAVHGFLSDPPKALEIEIQTPATQLLLTFGFEKVVKMLLAGRREIEMGNSSGLDELRGAIENFLYMMVEKIGEPPAELHNPERNISKLGVAGYLDKEMESLIRTVLFNQVYGFISDKKTHKRLDLDLLTSRLLFDLSESSMIFLSDRILKYKFKEIRTIQEQRIETDKPKQ